MSADRKQRAAEVARALMRNEGITAAQAAQQLATDFGMSPETLRRAILDVRYSKARQRSMTARIEQLEMRVAELERLVVSLRTTGRKRFTDAQVREIRERYATGDVTQGDLAQEYGVNVQTMGAVIRGTSYGPAISDDDRARLRRSADLRSGNRRLDVEDVRKIRSRYHDGEESPKVLAEQFGMAEGTIRAIITGRTWKNVEGAADGKMPVRSGRPHRRHATRDQVQQIRNEYRRGDVSQSELAARHGMHEATIALILFGEGSYDPISDDEREDLRRTARLRRGSRRLSARDVRVIRARFDEHEESIAGMATEFGVSYSTIQGVVSRRTWKEVQ